MKETTASQGLGAVKRTRSSSPSVELMSGPTRIPRKATSLMVRWPLLLKMAPPTPPPSNQPSNSSSPPWPTNTHRSDSRIVAPLTSEGLANVVGVYSDARRNNYLANAILRPLPLQRRGMRRTHVEACEDAGAGASPVLRSLEQASSPNRFGEDPGQRGPMWGGSGTESGGGSSPEADQLFPNQSEAGASDRLRGRPRPNPLPADGDLRIPTAI